MSTQARGTGDLLANTVSKWWFWALNQLDASSTGFRMPTAWDVASTSQIAKKDGRQVTKQYHIYYKGGIL